jgi:hypothetical protein
MSDPLTIHRIQIHNVGGVAEIDVSIEGKPVVVFGGGNEQGKTCILRALGATLGSEAPLPGRAGSKDAKMSLPGMLRDDELAGNCRLELGDGIVIERKWTESVQTGKRTSKLFVSGLDTTGGAVKALQRLWSRFAVDLARFEQLDAVEQGNQVRQLLGIDWTKLDARDAEIRAERKAVNAEVKRLEGYLAKLEPHDDAPAEEVSTAKLLAELKSRQKHNAGLNDIVHRRNDAEGEVARCQTRIDRNDEEIGRLEARIAALRKANGVQRGHQVEYQAVVAAAQRAIDAFEEQPVDDVEEQLRTADETNRRVRARKEHERVSAELAAEQKKAADHDKALEAIKAEKRQQLAAQGDSCPEGAGFDRWGNLQLDGRPYRENSTGRRMRFIVPLYLDACPRVKVVLVDELPLDGKNLQLVAELAAARGGQVIASKLGTEGATHVVEGGRVKC